VGLSSELLNADHHHIYYAGVPRPGLRRHGDYLARVEGGRYRALGRVDDTMNLGGIKVSSAELEEAVLRLPGVREAAAVSVPESDGGAERLAVFVVPEDGPERSAAAWRPIVQDAVSTALNPLFRVHRVVVAPSLPRTASNKIKRRELRAELEG
jgi:acetyl-CoA synthetase